jgi:ELWxxDGT repeat protein
MAGDNQLSGAINVGFGTNRNGRVGTRDLEDLYRVNLSRSGSLDVNLSAIVPRKASKQVARKTRVGVELYRLRRPFDEVVGSIGSVDFSRLDASEISANFELVRASRARSTRRASIALNSLDAGDYVIRVRQNKLEGRYRLSVGGSLVPEEIVPPVENPPPAENPPPIENPPPSGGGNSIETAVLLPFPFTQQGGSVNDSDRSDYYKVSVPGAGDYKFDLFNLDANADIQIIRSDGTTLLKSATSPGNQAESILVPLEAEDYYIHVVQGTAGDASRYSLNMTALTDAAPGTRGGGDATATLLTPPNTFGLVTSNYVLDGAKNSTEDFYKIIVGTRSFLSLELKGKSTSGSLTGNLDIEFLDSAFAPILTAARPGTSAESFGGTLDPGTYYIQVKPATPGSLEGSEYNLSMSLSDKTGIPSVTRDINSDKLPTFDDNDVVIGYISQGSGADNLTSVGGFTYFSTNEGGSQSLWRTDGTLKGTQKIQPTNSTGAPIVFQSLTRFTATQNFLYFVGKESANGSEIWRTDGTAGGTVLLTKSFAPTNPANALPQIADSDPEDLVAAGNRVYFTANNTTGDGRQFYRTNAEGTAIEFISDGTTSTTPGPGQIPSPTDIPNDLNGNPFDVKNLAYYGTTLYFSAETLDGEGELWTITNAGDASPGALAIQNLNGGEPSNPSQFVVANNKLYGYATVNSSPSLRNIVGNTATTVTNGTGLTDLDNFLTVGTKLYFTATSSTLGKELFQLDTTNDTVSPAIDVVPGQNSSSPSDLVAIGESVYFFADKAGGGRVLWKYGGSGSTATEVPITDSVAGGGTLPNELTAIGNVLYFTATSATKGLELWGYNTSNTPESSLAAGEMKLIDINPTVDPLTSQNNSSNPGQLTNINGRLYFVANNGVDGRELMSLF